MIKWEAPTSSRAVTLMGWVFGTAEGRALPATQAPQSFPAMMRSSG